MFLNTSRHFLGGFDLIYDEADGFVGYRWTGNASGARGGVNAAAGGPCRKSMVQSAVHPASAEVGSERD